MTSAGRRRILPILSATLLDSAVASRTRAALTGLSSADAAGFDTLFHRCDGAATEGMTISEHWQSEEAIEWLANLTSVGLLVESAGRYDAPFLVVAWPSGSFYIADRPDSGHADEVFCTYFEQRAFFPFLQVRPNDRVLDLGTGSGLLLIEAVRRGATGIGVDKNLRALHFARVNACLNGVADRVVFVEGDITKPPVGNEWGEPTVVVCNPPFEPAPTPGALALHSDGGDDGTAVVEEIVGALEKWAHRPLVIQFVLFSLTLSAQPGPSAPRSIGATEIPSGRLESMLSAAAGRLGATLELREAASPLPLRDVFFLRHGRLGPDVETAWYSRLRQDIGATHPAADTDWRLHLLVGTFYASNVSTSTPARSKLSWAQARDGDECFVLPACYPGLSSTESVYSAYLDQLLITRESEIKGLAVNLSLSDKRIQAFVQSLTQHAAMFGDNERLILVDLQRNGGKPKKAKVLLLHPGSSPASCEYRECSSAELLLILEEWDCVGATICDVDQSPPYLSSRIHAGAPSEVVEEWFAIGNHIQRFVAAARWPAGCLTPVRQKIFANLLSELVHQVQHIESERVHALEGIGHSLRWVSKLTRWNTIHEALIQTTRRLPDRVTPELAQTLEQASASFALFSLTQGLGSLVRVAGAISKGHFGRIKDWYDPSGFANWNMDHAADIGVTYAHTIFAIAKMVCWSADWPTLSVTCRSVNNGESALVWNFPKPPFDERGFRPHELAVPPFCTGKDVIYVLITAIGEPVLNAANAMNKDGIPTATPIRIRVISRPPEEVVIEVGNRTTRREEVIGKPPPGVADTEKLLKSTDLGFYGLPYPDPHEDGWVWLPLRFRPYTIAKALHDLQIEGAG